MKTPLLLKYRNLTFAFSPLCSLVLPFVTFVVKKKLIVSKKNPDTYWYPEFYELQIF